MICILCYMFSGDVNSGWSTCAIQSALWWAFLDRLQTVSLIQVSINTLHVLYPHLSQHCPCIVYKEIIAMSMH